MCSAKRTSHCTRSGWTSRRRSIRPTGPAQPTGADILTELAEATGGRYFEAWSPKDQPGIMKRIDIRQQYVLGYSPAPLNADGKYHRVELG